MRRLPKPPAPGRCAAATLAGLALAACDTGPSMTPLSLGAPEVMSIRTEAPPGAAPGTCWGRDATPAVIETITEQVLVSSPTTGNHAAPAASYRTETRQKIVRERQEMWFRTPCPPEVTPVFIESLQRALEARGVYDGPITGELDGPTRQAIRAYQKPEGLDSSILSLAAARKLGLAVVEVPGATDQDMLPVQRTG